MIERQVLEDAIGVCRGHNASASEGASAFGAFSRQQVPFAGAAADDFAGAGDLEPFCHGFAGLNSFGASHSIRWAIQRPRCLFLWVKKATQSTAGVRGGFLGEISLHLFLGVRFQTIYNRLLGGTQLLARELIENLQDLGPLVLSGERLGRINECLRLARSGRWFGLLVNRRLRGSLFEGLIRFVRVSLLLSRCLAQLLRLGRFQVFRRFLGIGCFLSIGSVESVRCLIRSLDGLGRDGRRGGFRLVATDG